jgi:hypothetical protein
MLVAELWEYQGWIVYNPHDWGSFWISIPVKHEAIAIKIPADKLP